MVSSDIINTSWVDVVADAQHLPFQSASFSNVIFIDVLHHIEQPCAFINEAERVLCTGGRIVMIEPAMTPLSSIFYRLFHPEPVDMSVDPFEHVSPDPDRKPFDANQAVPTLLFGKYRKTFEDRFDGLSIVHVERFDFLAYPLSGGFRSWSLIPASAVAPLEWMENLIASALGWLAAFRMLVVLEKKTRDR